MAIAFDTSTYGLTSSDSTTLTFSHTCTGSNLILFVYAVSDTSKGSVTGVTYNGTAMTSVQTNNGSFNHQQSMWYIINPATGAHNVVVTQNGSNGKIRAYAASYTGASQTGQPDASLVPSEQTTTSYARAVTTVADNCWVVWGVCAMSGATLTAGSNTAVRHQPEITAFGAAYCDSNSAFTPAGSKTLTVTSNSQLFCSIMASFSPAGATSAIKTINGLSKSAVKTVGGLAIANLKTFNGLT